MWACLLVAFAIGGAALAQTPSPNEKKTISITWLGHAAFEIVSRDGTHLLIDPFPTKNPATPAENKDEKVLAWKWRLLNASLQERRE